MFKLNIYCQCKIGKVCCVGAKCDFLLKLAWPPENTTPSVGHYVPVNATLSVYVHDYSYFYVFIFNNIKNTLNLNVFE